MFKKLFITAIFVTTWMQASAQTLEKEYKASSEGNPISPCVFCADPTAIDYNIPNNDLTNNPNLTQNPGY